MVRYHYIVPLIGDLSFGRSHLGGKGQNLQRLIDLNCHVPGGFVITTAAFREVLRGVLAANPSLSPGSLDEAMQRAPIPLAMQEEILDAARKLRTLTGAALVVRSSATAEDHQHSSMAGQAATFMNIVTGEQLLAAVCGCWASLFSRESVLYRSARMEAPPFPEMAVVVQQLVPAHRAGVLFTVDPVTGDEGNFLLSASWGLGETVVSGRAADTVYMDRDGGRVVQAEIAVKEGQLVPARGGGTRLAALAAKRAREPVLDSALCARLHGLAVRLEEAFGEPLDLEWAEWDERLYLLQARPVTAVRTGRPREVFSSSNVGEALPGVGTPFTWSIIHAFARRGLLHAFRGLGCKVPDDYSIIGRIRGRIYLNISEFMSVASQVPFVTPEMLERLAGGGGAEYVGGTFRQLPRTGFLARLPWTIGSTLFARTINPARVALWSPKFKAFTRRFERARLETFSRGDLLRLWDETYAVFENTGTLTLECYGQFLMSYLGISLALKAVLGAEAESTERALFSGLSGIRSAEPGLDLLRMARSIRNMPELRRKVLSTPSGQLLDVLAAGNPAERSLHSATESFLRSHGHRAAREAEVLEPRWREDPGFPLAMLKRYVESDCLPDPEEMVRERMALREKNTQAVLARLPRLSRHPFLRLLGQAQEAARLREEMRNAVVHTLGFFRSLALQVGRRLEEAGTLGHRDDVFFLTREEILEWLAGEGDLGRLPLLVAMRRLEHEALCSLPAPPPWFIMEDDRIMPRQTEMLTGRSLRGLPGSPGIATGRVAVVRDLREQSKVRPGDVLVAPFTDVGWTPLFLVASAVVTELGGPLSHSCVVAREYGVPAVVNVNDACSQFEDGTLVSVNGDSGLVVLEQEGDG